MSHRNGKDIAHEWAHGRDHWPARSNVGASSGTIFSYGRHFPIARFYGSDRKICLFTSKEYSVSTSKHKSYVRCAIPDGVRVFKVARVGGWSDISKSEHKANYRDFLEQAARLMAKSEKPRLRQATRDSLISSAERLRVEANDYNKAFSLGFREVKSLGATVERVKRAEAAEEKRLKKLAEDRAAAAAAELAEARSDLERWKQGESVQRFFGAYRDLSPAFRIESGSKGRIVQTSLGARFSAKSARAAYPRLREVLAGLEVGQTWSPAAGSADESLLTFDGYKLSTIDAEAVRVGCHRIEWAEVERLAVLLGLHD